MKYRKKPVVIEAIQWFKNGDHPQDYEGGKDQFERGVIKHYSAQYLRDNDWEGKVVRRFRRPDVSGEQICGQCGNTVHVHGWIDTLEGGHIVCPNDYIITGVKGERYPCKPDIFAMTYEPISEGTP